MTSVSSARASPSSSRASRMPRWSARPATGPRRSTIVESTAPDVVLMDLRMPRMDGVEATRAIRERHPDVAVVVLTTYADDDSIVAALVGGRGRVPHQGCGPRRHPPRPRGGRGRPVRARSAVQATLLRAAQHGVGPPGQQVPDGLTEREVEVLGLIASGLPTRRSPSDCSWPRPREDAHQSDLRQDGQP